MKPTSKAAFLEILSRQQQSGLSIKAFCENESYPASSFYYWKSKFGLTRPYNNHLRSDTAELFAPISFSQSANPPVQSAISPYHSSGEIRIELPGGIRFIFIGDAETQIAVSFIRQIYSAHVLPE